MFIIENLKRLSDEKISYIKTCDYGRIPYLDYYNTNNFRVNCNGGCLKQDRPTLLHIGIVNVHF